MFSVRIRRNVRKYKIFGITIFRTGKNPKEKGPYGMLSILEAYCNVKIDPQIVQVQHGWTPLGTAVNRDLWREKTEIMLCWNKRYKFDWDKKSTTPCYIVGSPFVHYRRMHNIEQSQNARGTLAYPGHSVVMSRAEYDIDEYCQQLRELPDEFQPVTISLHYADIANHGIDKEFEKRGFKTVCAFLGTSKPCYEVFYDILREYKYTTSNEIGSYTFYSVEMGMPFFLLGTSPVIDSDDNIEGIEGKYAVKDLPYGKKATELFLGRPRMSITQEQKAFVVEELGMDDCLSADALRSILAQT